MKLTYILFKIEDLYFLIPLQAVIAVEPGNEPDETGKDAWDFGYLCEIRKQKKATDYILALTTGRETFRIYADLVIGVRTIEDEMMKELKAPLIWERNQYLESAALLEDLDPPIAYILNVSGMHEKILRKAEPADTEI